MTGWVVIGILVIIGTGIYFQTSEIGYEPYTPSQPSYPPVDYSVDKNRLTCIMNRTPEELQKLCEEAFP